MKLDGKYEAQDERVFWMMMTWNAVKNDILQTENLTARTPVVLE